MKKAIVLMALIACSTVFGQIEIKQSTSTSFPIGPFSDPTTGAFEVALTLRAADIELWQRGDTDFAAKSDSTDCTYEKAGEYRVYLDATDTAVLGLMKIIVVDPNITPAGADEPNAIYISQWVMVLDPNAWDLKYSTGELKGVNLDEAIGTLSDAQVDTLTVTASLAAGAITNASLAGNMEIVFETDFDTNYNTTLDRWAVDVNNWSLDPMSVATAFSDVGTIPDMNTAIATLLPSDFNTVGVTSGNIHVHLKAADDNVVVDANVASFDAGAINAAAIGTGAIDADALATDAITEIFAKALSDVTGVPIATDSVITALSHMYQRMFAPSTQTTTELQQSDFAGTKRFEQTTTKTASTSMAIGAARAND